MYGLEAEMNNLSMRGCNSNALDRLNRGADECRRVADQIRMIEATDQFESMRLQADQSQHKNSGLNASEYAAVARWVNEPSTVDRLNLRLTAMTDIMTALNRRPGR